MPPLLRGSWTESTGLIENLTRHPPLDNLSSGSTTMNATLTALFGFVAWTLFLIMLMEACRFKFILTAEIPANQFRPDNSNLPPFMQRLARAHANCLEGLPIFGGLMVVAMLANKSSVTDPLAYTLLAARIVQSLIHLSSVSVAASWLRFFAFAVQVGIAVYWAFGLLPV